MLTLLILFLIFRALMDPWRWHRPWGGMRLRPWGMFGGWGMGPRRPPMGGFSPGPHGPGGMGGHGMGRW